MEIIPVEANDITVTNIDKQQYLRLTNIKIIKIVRTNGGQRKLTFGKLKVLPHQNLSGRPFPQASHKTNQEELREPLNGPRLAQETGVWGESSIEVGTWN